MDHESAIEDKKNILDEIYDWPQLLFPMPKMATNTKKFNTTNRAKTKDGLFFYPPNALTLAGEEDYSIEMFEDMINLGEEANIDFGFDYGKQQNAIDGGIKGIIHWYICQYLKTNTLSSNNDLKSMPLKAIYIVEGKKLFLGSVFRLLSRHTKYPHYSIIGQVICTYIEWCKAKQSNDFVQLDRLAHVLFGLGTEMAKAENERKIIAGNSRTDIATDEKHKNRNERIALAKAKLPIAIDEIRTNNEHCRLTRKRVCKKIAKMMSDDLELSKPISYITVDKYYLLGINFNKL